VPDVPAPAVIAAGAGVAVTLLAAGLIVAALVGRRTLGAGR
jgi:hypothetical protein